MNFPGKLVFTACFAVGQQLFEDIDSMQAFGLNNTYANMTGQVGFPCGFYDESKCNGDTESNDETIQVLLKDMR